MFEGHPVMTGAVTSLTITLNVQVDALPDPSVKVYVTGVVPFEKTSPGLWFLEVLTAPQLSVAVGAVQLTEAWHDEFADTVISDGQFEITGLVTSLTITLNAQVDEFPDRSEKVYVTWVVPFGNVAPEVCVLETFTVPQLSDAVGAVQVAVAW
jgi:hypothetical protein